MLSLAGNQSNHNESTLRCHLILLLTPARNIAPRRTLRASHRAATVARWGEGMGCGVRAWNVGWVQPNSVTLRGNESSPALREWCAMSWTPGCPLALLAWLGKEKRIPLKMLNAAWFNNISKWLAWPKVGKLLGELRASTLSFYAAIKFDYESVWKDEKWFSCIVKWKKTPTWVQNGAPVIILMKEKGGQRPKGDI